MGLSLFWLVPATKFSRFNWSPFLGTQRPARPPCFFVGFVSESWSWNSWFWASTVPFLYQKLGNVWGGWRWPWSFFYNTHRLFLGTLYVGNEHISHIPTKREEKVTIIIIDSRSLTTFGRRYVIVRLQEGYPWMISVDLDRIFVAKGYSIVYLKHLLSLVVWCLTTKVLKQTSKGRSRFDAKCQLPMFLGFRFQFEE